MPKEYGLFERPSGGAPCLVEKLESPEKGEITIHFFWTCGDQDAGYVVYIARLAEPETMLVSLEIGSVYNIHVHGRTRVVVDRLCESSLYWRCRNYRCEYDILMCSDDGGCMTMLNFVTGLGDDSKPSVSESITEGELTELLRERYQFVPQSLESRVFMDSKHFDGEWFPNESAAREWLDWNYSSDEDSDGGYDKVWNYSVDITEYPDVVDVHSNEVKDTVNYFGYSES
jgi:hypothetical protein